MANLIPPFPGIGRSPHHHKGIDNRSYWLELRHKKHSTTRLAFLKTVSKMLQHRPPIVSNQDAALAGRILENVGIRNSCEFTVCCGCEVDCRLAPPYRNNYSVVDIGVRLEADQIRDSPILARARCSLSQSSGFSSDSGMLSASNSRELAAK